LYPIITTLLLTGAVSALGAMRRSPGSMNDDGEMPIARRRDAPLATRTAAQIALPNRELARRVVDFNDVLGDMSFEQAVNEDPRRAEALIYQAIGRGFQRAGVPRGNDDMYAQGLELARNASGAPLTVRALLDLHASNVVNTMLTPMAMAPGSVKAQLRAVLPELEAGYLEAAEIARRAQLAAADPEDRLDWRQYVDFLELQPEALRRALMRQLPGPVGVRGELPMGGRRRLG
jgi:hypothetical protein